MIRPICSSRIAGRLFVVLALVLLGSTFNFAQSNTNNTDPSAAAQWKPGAPQVQLEGQLEIMYQDFQDGHSRSLYTLKQSDGTRLPLQFVKQPPTHLLTGARIRVNGQRSGGGLVLYSGSSVKNTGGGSTGGGTTSPSVPVPNTFGTQSVLVILVNFQDAPTQPYTVADAQLAFFTTANAFFVENSYGQTSLVGDIVGWFTIPDSVTACNTSQIAADAQSSATAAGINLTKYSRYVYAFPQNSACGFAGASLIGGAPSQSWINGTTGPGGTSLSVHVINHELGHAFGLWHAHSLDCGTTASSCSNGTVQEYGDVMDVMGSPQTATPDYNAFQKERLGWLNYGASPSIQTVTTSGTYTIYPYELAGPGPNALKVLQSTDTTTGAKSWYYIESRQAVGVDAFLTDWPYYYSQNETTGVLFHLGTDGNGNSGDLLDMTPATPTSQNYWDMSLAVDQTYQDSAAGVTFIPTAITSASATIQIQMNGSGCTPENPTVTVSPLQSQAVAPGTSVSFTVAVTNNDSSGCSTVNFNLGSTVPPGWAGTWSTAGLSLSPGKSGSATLTVISPEGTADGSYGVSVTAINASTGLYNASAAAAYLISTAPLSVSLTTNQSSYVPGQTVRISVGLQYGTLPDVGAGVTVIITAPNGKSTTLSGTTGSNGVALLNYKLSRHAAAGTYPVRGGVGTTGSGGSNTAAAIGGASTTFTVQ